MTCMTIALPNERIRGVRDVAARTGRSVAQVVDDVLAAYGVPPGPPLERVLEILESAGRNAGLDEDEAMALAVAETRAHRAGH